MGRRWGAAATWHGQSELSAAAGAEPRSLLPPACRLPPGPRARGGLPTCSLGLLPAGATGAGSLFGRQHRFALPHRAPHGAGLSASSSSGSQGGAAQRPLPGQHQIRTQGKPGLQATELRPPLLRGEAPLAIAIEPPANPAPRACSAGTGFQGVGRPLPADAPQLLSAAADAGPPPGSQVILFYPRLFNKLSCPWREKCGGGITAAV